METSEVADAKVADAKVAPEYTRCPHCDGRGAIDTFDNQRGQATMKARGMPVCRVCKGRGFVDLNRTCECGGAAVMYHAEKKVWYCGHALCAEAARRRAAGLSHWSATYSYAG